MVLPANYSPAAVRSILGQAQIIQNGLTFTRIGFTPYVLDGSYVATPAAAEPFTGIGGVSVNDDIYNSEFLFAYANAGNKLAASTDGGYTWNSVFDNAGTGLIDIQHDIVGGPVNGGSVMWSSGTTVFGRTSLVDLQVNGGWVNGANAIAQNLGGLFQTDLGGPPPTNEGDDLPIRLAYDRVNGWWIAAAGSSGDLAISTKDDSLLASSSSGWNAISFASTLEAKGIAVGKGAGGSTTTVVVDGTGSYWYMSDVVTPAWTQSGDLNTGVSGWSGRDIRNVVYNDFWGKWMFLGDSVRFNGDPSCLVLDPENMGASSTNDFDRPIAGNFLELNSVTLQNGGAAVAVGPWCYFNTDKGGTSSGILGTPDLGRTWYLRDFYSRSDIDGDQGYVNSMGKWDGRLVFTVGRVGFTNHTALYATPRLEVPRPTAYVG